MDKIKVLAKLNEDLVITAINSSLFLKDTTGYICIDTGKGDKYAHAQGNYLEKGLTDEKGRYNYKYLAKQVVELTEAEKESLFPTPTPQATELEKLDARVTYLEIMSEVL